MAELDKMACIQILADSELPLPSSHNLSRSQANHADLKVCFLVWCSLVPASSSFKAQLPLSRDLLTNFLPIFKDVQSPLLLR